MWWSPRQLILPLLITFSLTGVSVALLHFLNSKAKKKHVHDIKCVEVKIPHQFTPAVIGRAGMVLKSIRDNSGATCTFKNDEDMSVDVCVVSGSAESVELAQSMIKDIIENQPIIETDETFVPEETANKLTSRRGDLLRQIHWTSKAKLIVDHMPYKDSQRRIVIRGTAHQIKHALALVNDIVQEDAKAKEQLAAYAAVNSSRTKPLLESTTGEVDDKSNESKNEKATETVSPQDLGKTKVYVSATNTPSQFWVQMITPSTYELITLINEMSDYYEIDENRKQHVLQNIEVGQKVATILVHDKRWYRAIVAEKFEDDNICDVFFIDYGDREFVNNCDIYEISTEFLSLQPQAVECSLANVKPRNGEWSEEACEAFGKLTAVASFTELKAKVHRYNEQTTRIACDPQDESTVPCLDLYTEVNGKMVDIGAELIRMGFADPVEPDSTESLLQTSPRNSPDIIESKPELIKPEVTTPEVTTPEVTKPEETKPEVTKPEVIKSEETPVPTPSEAKRPEPSKTANKKKPKIIDLTRTPKKNIIEVDLVTPVKAKNSSQDFINSQKMHESQNGGGDSFQNRAKTSYGGKTKRMNSYGKKEPANIRAAGAEDSDAGNSDEMEMF